MSLLLWIAQTDYATRQAAERAAPYPVRVFLLLLGLVILAIVVSIIDRRR